MQLDNYRQIIETSNNKSFTYEKIEIAIRSSLTVDDCVVLERQTKNLKHELIVYVVPSGLFAREQLLSHLQKVLPSELIPRAFIPVSSIPITDTVQLDEATLASLEVIDTDLMIRLEKQLYLLSEINSVAVVTEPLITNIPPVHLEDLLGDNQVFTTENSQQNLPSIKPIQNIENKNLSSTNKLAVSHGEPLQHSPDAPKTLVNLLEKAAKNTNKGIIFVQTDGSEKFQSYSELFQNAQRIASGLKKLGFKPQDKVIFQLEDNQDFLSAFWGCVLGGFVPVAISVAKTYEQLNTITSKLQNTWQILGKPLVLTSDALASKIASLATQLNLENLQLATIEQLYECEADENLHQSQPEDLAILFLTSGSTGIPKCVMLNHRNLLSMTNGFIVMGNFSHQDSVLNWMPLDHVGALVSLSILAINLGCQQIHVPTNLIVENPLKWLDLIDNHQATISWTPNFAFSLICDRASEIQQKHWNLSSMRFIINAGEPIVTKVARSFLKLLRPYSLPSNAIHPAFGMCETASGITYSNSFSLASTSDDASFVELGLPIAGASVRIVDENEQIVPEDTIGRLQVKGASVTSGYYQNPQANQEAFTSDGWFNTGDLGFLHQGRLTITGRIKDVIIINGLNYYCHEIEAAVEELKAIEVSYTAACAVRQPRSNTDKLAIFFHTSVSGDRSLVNLLKEIRTKVVNKIGINPDYLISVDKEIIPKTAIGKIQRSQLSQRFKTGEFQSIIKQIDILIGNPNTTIPDWFYQKVWRQKPAKILQPLPQDGLTIVFLDRLGLGEFICQQLQQQNLPYICVSPSYDFTQASPNHFCLKPGNAEHYQQLFKAIKAEKLNISQILHLWNYQDYGGEINNPEALEQVQEYGIYSLLFIIQALEKIRTDQNSIQLLFISSYTQSTKPTDKIAYEKSPVLGVLKTIPHEIPWLNCRHIDLPTNLTEVNANYILQELQSVSKEQEVAYRDNKRLVAGLEKVNLQHKPKQALPFKQGGMYVISGGLGGVAVEIAKYLIKFFDAKLLLLGRTPLPSTKSISASILDKVKAYEELKQLGTVVYEAVDICDLSATQQVIEKAKNIWVSQLDGVIHLAGTYHEQMLVDETPEGLAAILRPKVLGAWVLHQVLKGKGVFISFSSLASFFGGATIAAYAAANNFLESFNQYQNSVAGLRSYCFAWTIWRDTGINKGYQRQEIIRAQGYYDMSLQQGLYSFLAGLYHDQTALIVGLDGSHAKIQRFTSQFQGLQKLTAYFTSKDGAVVPKLPDLTVRDRFGKTVNCDFVQLSEMPLTPSGEINRDLLAKGMARKSATTPPRNDTERQIAQTWQDVLGIPQIGIHDNFFELGGNSLLVFQVIARLREAFAVELSPNRFFASPTVAGLGESLEALLTVGKQWNESIDDAENEYEVGVL
ncbi:AMP-binding protein [Nostocaceae cyanobacterium CENA369]|uniref:AMP-binding protein n=1 Tax=Dendronalium phyllosphericum CENA369 TaxID=1725256 RepID=A0A8J7I9W7_9NOST|nr:AMP-binding protein [Dendronalium phyllosphericum]MBH8578114.1 AMP-binding protein [Dendronalium phyllosphericum CENA369]